MAVPDPVDARLLTLVAEVGRVAVHDLAARAGLDVREVAARLAALAATGLPLVVGVECDPGALRFALARQGWPPVQQGPAPQGPGTVSGPYQVNAPSGQYSPAQFSPAGPSSGPQAVPAYQPGPGAAPGYPAMPPSGPGSGQNPAVTGPSGPVRLPTGTAPAGPGGWGRAEPAGPGGPPSQPFPAVQPGAVQPGGSDPSGTWGPPQTATWARGDQEPLASTATVRTVPQRPGGDQRAGVVGDALQTEGLEGERLAIQLVEVVDPADFLFTAAGYRLQPGERSVVVHTELTNRGAVPFGSLPDLYLVLVDVAGQTVSKAPVSLSSRPPHRIGVQPGETAGGHTVYVLPDSTELAAVRWSPRPDDERRALTWSLRE